MKHYKTLMNALAGAIPVCMTWKLAGTEEGMNARDVYALALEEGGDEEELPEQDFYVVSAEGAIGLTTRYEYLTRWLFIPVTGEEKEREMERLRAELRFDQETAEAEAKARAAVQSAQPEMQPQSAPKRFCTSCGKPLNPGVKFCRNCGARVE